MIFESSRKKDRPDPREHEEDSQGSNDSGFAIQIDQEGDNLAIRGKEMFGVPRNMVRPQQIQVFSQNSTENVVMEDTDYGVVPKHGRKRAKLHPNCLPYQTFDDGFMRLADDKSRKKPNSEYVTQISIEYQALQKNLKKLQAQYGKLGDLKKALRAQEAESKKAKEQADGTEQQPEPIEEEDALVSSMNQKHKSKKVVKELNQRLEKSAIESANIDEEVPEEEEKDGEKKKTRKPRKKESQKPKRRGKGHPIQEDGEGQDADEKDKGKSKQQSSILSHFKAEQKPKRGIKIAYESDDEDCSGPKANLLKHKLSYKSQIRLADDDILKTHHRERFIDTYDIYFPYGPYQVQNAYMESVLRAIKEGENALLESPTGTGKTLCLLVAAITALKKEKEAYKKTKQIWGQEDESNLPRIVYCSRTFSQLDQVLRELKKTVYKLDVVLMGSRDQLCVNEDINRSGQGLALRCECRQARRNTRCQYFLNYEKNTQSIPLNGFSIEELHLLGKIFMTCPYYLQKKQVTNADLILMPYNYLIDEEIRQRSQISYRNCILIIDEAHNIASCSEEAASFNVNTHFLMQTIDELKQLKVRCQFNEERGEEQFIIHKMKKAAADSEQSKRVRKWQFKSKYADLEKLYDLTVNFLDYLSDFKLPEDESKRQVKGLDLDNMSVFPGSKMIDIFLKATKFQELFESEPPQPANNNPPEQAEEANPQKKAELYWETVFANATTDAHKLFKSQKNKMYIETFEEILRKILRYRNSQEDSDNKYRMDANFKYDYEDFIVVVYNDVIEEYVKKRKVQKVVERRVKTLGFWCYNAGNSFRQIMSLKPRSVILTSGTLSPMESFEKELQVHFKYKLENRHVINEDQARVAILSTGANSEALNFTYKNSKNNDELLESLADCLLKISRTTDGGILIFFPSYNALSKFVKFAIKKKLDFRKLVQFESSDSSSYPTIMADHKRYAIQGGGAILMGVCRGKMSEGLDFTDKLARCVVIVGLPFPQSNDPRVKQKKEFLNARQLKIDKTTGKYYSSINGAQWYQQTTIRAVNQAIGRAIRHRWDFGSIVLIDKRYKIPDNFNSISAWLRERIVKYDSLDALYKDSLRFFRWNSLRDGNGPVDLKKFKQLEQEERTESTQDTCQSRAMTFEDFFQANEDQKQDLKDRKEKYLRFGSTASTAGIKGNYMNGNLSFTSRPQVSVSSLSGQIQNQIPFGAHDQLMKKMVNTEGFLQTTAKLSGKDGKMPAKAAELIEMLKRRQANRQKVLKINLSSKGQEGVEQIEEEEPESRERRKVCDDLFSKYAYKAGHSKDDLPMKDPIEVDSDDQQSSNSQDQTGSSSPLPCLYRRSQKALSPQRVVQMEDYDNLFQEEKDRQIDEDLMLAIAQHFDGGGNSPRSHFMKQVKAHLSRGYKSRNLKINPIHDDTPSTDELNSPSSRNPESKEKLVGISEKDLLEDLDPIGEHKRQEKAAKAKREKEKQRRAFKFK